MLAPGGRGVVVLVRGGVRAHAGGVGVGAAREPVIPAGLLSAERHRNFQHICSGWITTIHLPDSNVTVRQQYNCQTAI
jgi:hypothetical protein